MKFNSQLKVILVLIHIYIYTRPVRVRSGEVALNCPVEAPQAPDLAKPLEKDPKHMANSQN